MTLAVDFESPAQHTVPVIPSLQVSLHPICIVLVMKYSLAPIWFLAAATQAVAATVTVSYDMTYDVASTSLNEVACSDGANGLESKGYTTFGRCASLALCIKCVANM
jgi:hypothetical protein